MKTIERLVDRQGDVGFISVGSVNLSKAKKLPHCILALGEVTGHMHQVVEKTGAELYELEGKMFLKVNAEGGISVAHNTHAPVTISPDTYEIRIADEYDEEDAFRKVAD